MPVVIALGEQTGIELAEVALDVGMVPIELALAKLVDQHHADRGALAWACALGGGVRAAGR